jgi:hypothetical protein
VPGESVPKEQETHRGSELVWLVKIKLQFLFAIIF